MNNTRYDRAGVIEKYGVPPERIIDYLALTGDASDNVPGIPKVGPKTAVKWLAEYGSLDAIVADAHSFSGKVGEYLRENLGQIPLSRQLVTLKSDLELPVEPQQLLISDQDQLALREHYRRWGFRSWLPDINGGRDELPSHRENPAGADAGPDSNAQAAETAQAAEENYETIFTVEQLERWVDKLAVAGAFSIDTETTDLDYMRAELVGLSFSVRAGEAAYVPVAHTHDGAPKQISRRKVLEKLRPLLESEKHEKIGQNLKYDRNVLANYRVELNGIAHDSMLQSYVLDSVANAS